MKFPMLLFVALLALAGCGAHFPSVSRRGSALVTNRPRLLLVGPAVGHASDGLDRPVTLYRAMERTGTDEDCASFAEVVNPHHFVIPAGQVLCAAPSTGTRDVVFHVRQP